MPPVTDTGRSASGNGNGRRNIASNTENIVVLVAMPSVRHDSDDREHAAGTESAKA